MTESCGIMSSVMIVEEGHRVSCSVCGRSFFCACDDPGAHRVECYCQQTEGQTYTTGGGVVES